MILPDLRGCGRSTLGLPDAQYTPAAAAGDLAALLLQGRQDVTFPARLAEDAAGLIPSARAAVIEAAGHMTHVDQPRPGSTRCRTSCPDPAGYRIAAATA